MQYRVYLAIATKASNSGIKAMTNQYFQANLDSLGIFHLKILNPKFCDVEATKRMIYEIRSFLQGKQHPLLLSSNESCFIYSPEFRQFLNALEEQQLFSRIALLKQNRLYTLIDNLGFSFSSSCIELQAFFSKNHALDWLLETIPSKDAKPLITQQFEKDYYQLSINEEEPFSFWSLQSFLQKMKDVPLAAVIECPRNSLKPLLKALKRPFFYKRFRKLAIVCEKKPLFFRRKNIAFFRNDFDALDYIKEKDADYYANFSKEFGDKLQNILNLIEDYAKGSFDQQVELENENYLIRQIGQGVHFLGQELAAKRQKIQQQQEQILESLKLISLGKLSSSTSHEFRNPLYIASGFHQQIKKNLRQNYPKLYLELENDLEMAGESLDKIQKIIQKMSKKEDIVEKSFETLQLKNPLDKAIQRLAHNLEDIELSIVWPNESPYLRADPLKIEQLFLNLISNACDALKELCLAEKVIKISSYQKDHMLYVEIEDNGCGIELKDQSFIFEPFFSRKSDGTGLGLAICHEIVSEHRGKISCQSRPGEGTLMQIVFPL